MKARILGTIAAVGLIATVAPQGVSAQSANASIIAEAQVQVALTANGTQLLDFGAVFPGTTRNILPTDGTSGRLDLSGANNAEVTVSFTLPAVLTDIVTPANTLPVSFGASSAAWNFTGNVGDGVTTFNPSTGLTQRLAAGTGELHFYVGGSVSPTNEPQATYRGTISMTAAYTGN